MSERCGNCGTELLAGQQFCRRCGERVAAPDGDAPTRMLPDAQPAQGTTAFQPPRGTGDPPLTPRQTGPQTPFGGGAHTFPLAASAPHADVRKSGRKMPPLLLGLLLFLCLGGALSLVLFSRGTFSEKRFPVGDEERASSSSREAATVRPSDETALDEAGAIETGSETVLTKVFEVGADATFSFKNSDGGITVEGWDEDRVEMKVTKRGGTPEERRNARVTFKQSEDVFSLAAADSSVKISFEIKLPREAAKVELSSGAASVKVSKLEAPLAVSVRDGSISLEDVRGPTEAKSVNGNIEVVYRSAEREGPHEFKTVNGGVRIRLVEGMKADVSASVVNGKIEAADGLGLQPEKRQVGWRLKAPYGGGGEPLSVKTVNGPIKFQ